MSNGNQSRTRLDRVSQLDLPPTLIARALGQLRRWDVVLRVIVCLTAVMIMWSATRAWRPRFGFRTYQTPSRNIMARVTFEVEDPIETEREKEKVGRSIQCVYDHDPQQLVNLREALKDRVYHVFAAESLDQLDLEMWKEFWPEEGAHEQTGGPDPAVAFREIKELLVDDEKLQNFDRKLGVAFENVDRFGVLESLQHEFGEGSQVEITIQRLADGKRISRVPVEDLRMTAVLADLEQRLMTELGDGISAQMTFNWLKTRLAPTLSLNVAATEEVRELAKDDVGTVMTVYKAGEHVMADGGKPLTADEVELLGEEHAAIIKNTSLAKSVGRGVAALGMYVALYLLCGTFVYFRQPSLIKDLRRFITLQTLIVVTVLLAQICARDELQAELVPLMLFGMTTAIAHRQDVSLLLSAAISLIVVLSLGLGLVDFVIFAATLAATILLLRPVRTRTKLIYTGMSAGVVAFLTAFGVGIVSGQTVATPLLVLSLWYGLFAVLASILMTGLLPFVESWLDVQTEISLLELGDVAHPLLQELVRRAPGTYNHSINVASIAEAAAETIGADGLLVRVGAYFHDIGKMLKPQYFVENQAHNDNRHEALLPAMSTLIIIAHVKDGADLARQHHLPRSIIDFILQHHGTTLVEYFYDRANRQSEEDPDGGAVDEGSYRYPGPKPQTREAAVLMVADAVESASRSLQEPAPARIEALVREIAMKRLLDGQFDDCSLTLQELRMVEDSLVKSLTAMYHSRVKYPNQQSA